jgi:drug/metabolite transporter (DMT)-like permease
MVPTYQSELAVAVIAGLGGMLGWGFADFFAKKTIDAVGDIVTLAWAHVFGTAAFLIVVLLKLSLHHPVQIPDSIGTWLLLLLFGALQALIYLLLYRGFGKGQLAVLNPVFSSFSGITAFVSIAFLGEAARAGQWLILAVLFVGVMAISLDLRALPTGRIRLVRVPGLPEVVAATALAAVWTLGWNRFLEGKDWASYAALMYVFMTATILIASLGQRTVLTIKKSNVWSYMVLIGLCETGAYCAISMGYSATSRTSVIALTSGAFSLPTIVLARVFLNDRVNRIQGIGIALIISSIAALAFL